VLGYYQYHAVPGNTTQLRISKLRVCRLWQSVLVRRSQRAKALGSFYPSPELVDSSTPSSAPIPMHASTPLILRKSRMRKRARTDLCGARPAMVVPTATVIHMPNKSGRLNGSTQHLLEAHGQGFQQLRIVRER
jgi:hypothetical protein